MPEYGLCDKSPEELDEEKFIQEQQAIFKAAETAEFEARRRQVAAEESIIRTAEMLNQMSGQLQQIQDVQKAERQARIEAEAKADESAQRHEKMARNEHLWTVASTIAAMVAAIVGIVALFR